MEQKYFTNERNVQILIVLLKKYGIRKVIASPGTTNITFVASLMHDPYFELYSSVDERSAAYIACGLAEESGEPVVITCTGATASRNYVSGLTEAYYRHLPIIAVTATRDVSKIGHLNDQVIDRSQFLADTVKYSTLLQTVVNEKDEWDCTIKVNRALQELTRHGGGPVHINLTTTYSRDYKTQNIPDAKRIYKYYINDTFPELPQCRIGIHIGTHHKLSLEETEAIDNFCHCHNAVVFCEPNSGYSSKYRIPSSSVKEAQYPDLIIHLGDVCTFIPEMYGCKDVWRVHPDGEIRDRVQKLSKVFEMDIKTFFNYYANIISDTSDSYYKECRECYNNFVANIPELPFSNLWIANEFRKIIPEFSELHLGIAGTLRVWSQFDSPKNVDIYSNQGGYGIDGILSTAIGSSLYNKSRLYYVILGDLAFFYDLNSLGNRHVGNNIRIMIINNGRGNEFRLRGNPGSLFGDEADLYIAAAGHFGNKSKTLVKNYAENLGFKYLTASNKQEFSEQVKTFIDNNIKIPMIFEVFTEFENDRDSLSMLNQSMIKHSTIKTIAKKVLGDTVYEKIKELKQSKKTKSNYD